MKKKFPVGSPVKILALKKRVYAEVVGHCDRYVHVSLGGSTHKIKPEGLARHCD